jgi:hypothetical protein
MIGRSVSASGQIQKSECATGSPLCTQRTDILGRTSCPKNANPAATRSGLQVELRDIQTALTALREASGNGPCNDLGIIAGEPFERRQCAHDLTCAYQLHLCNNGRFDRHSYSSRTAERINSTAARGSGMRLRSRNVIFCGLLHHTCQSAAICSHNWRTSMPARCSIAAAASSARSSR